MVIRLKNILMRLKLSEGGTLVSMPVYFAPKVTGNYVSLIFPPCDNRGQNNEQSECLLRPQLFKSTVPVQSNFFMVNGLGLWMFGATCNTRLYRVPRCGLLVLETVAPGENLSSH